MTAIRPRIDMEDTFFEKGNQLSLSDCAFAYVEYNPKYDHEKSEDSSDISPCYDCSCTGCTFQCNSIQEYEEHYASKHVFECQTCHKHMPNSYLLDIHLEEAHDAYFNTMLEHHKAAYKCLVDTCSNYFSSEMARTLHLIDVHSYPKWFRFSSRIKKDEAKSNRKKYPLPWNRKLAAQDQIVSREDQDLIIEESDKDRERKLQRSTRRKLRNQNIPCRFYNSKSGCRRGNKCIFLHEESAVSTLDAIYDKDQLPAKEQYQVQKETITKEEEDITMEILSSDFAHIFLRDYDALNASHKLCRAHVKYW